MLFSNRERLFDSLRFQSIIFFTYIAKTRSSDNETQRFICILMILIGLLAVLPASAQTDVQPPASGWFFIKSVQYGDSNAGYWDQPGTLKKYEKGANLMVYAHDSSFDCDQQFRLISAGGDWYYIQSRNGGYVDVSKGESKNGTNVLIWEGTKRDNQKFRFQYLGDGRWIFFAANGGIVCLKGKSHEDRTNIHIWENHSGAFTEWYLRDSETYKIWQP